MSDEEVRRAGVLKRVKAKELKQVEAAEMLGLSDRQVKRQYQRFLALGAKGLVHGSAGKPSNRGRPVESAVGFWRWCGSTTAANWESGSDRHWRLSTSKKIMG